MNKLIGQVNKTFGIGILYCKGGDSLEKLNTQIQTYILQQDQTLDLLETPCPH